FPCLEVWVAHPERENRSYRATRQLKVRTNSSYRGRGHVGHGPREGFRFGWRYYMQTHILISTPYFQENTMSPDNAMQFGIMSVSDITRDPVTGYTPSEAERINAITAIARKTEEVGLDVFAIGEHHNPP